MGGQRPQHMNRSSGCLSPSFSVREAELMHALAGASALPLPSEGGSRQSREELFERGSATLNTGRQKKTALRMSSSLVVCEVEESLKAKLKQFRFRKETTNAAILMKIDMAKQLVILEEEYEDISLDELREELPERQPRFIVYSYKYTHADGRVSYPLCFIFSSPVGCKPEQQMMYAGSKNQLVQTAELTKVFETRNADDLTEEWLKNHLAFFR